MEDIKVVCKNCQKTLRAKPKFAGQIRQCPQCGHEIRIPAEELQLTYGQTDAELSLDLPVTPPPTATSVNQSYDSSFFYPLYFPFTDQGAVAQLWWLSILMYVPGINVLLLRGWRLELVSRKAAGLEPIYPPPSGIPKYLLKGILLWVMTFTYTIFPTLLILSLGIGGTRETIADMRELTMIIFQQSEQTLSQFLWNEFSEIIACFLIAGIWAMISSPLYRAGMIRYSVTGNIASFWHIPANAFFILKNALAFLKTYAIQWVAAFVVTFIALIFMETIVLVLIIPATLPLVYHWSTGYAYGSLAQKLEADIHQNETPNPSTS